MLHVGQVPPWNHSLTYSLRASPGAGKREKGLAWNTSSQHRTTRIYGSVYASSPSVWYDR